MSHSVCEADAIAFSRPPRRRFLGGLLAGGAAGLAYSQPGASAPSPEALPTIRLGDKTVSRLIAGGNPIGGYAYGTRKLSEHMLSYFTVERTADFLLHCEREGITTWQSHYSPLVRDALLSARDRGSKIQWIVLETEVRKEVLALRPIAMVHHGGATDRLFRAGQQNKVRDFVKVVHDAGLLAGVSTHNPDHLARVEDSAWENDFYMACFYNLTRTPEELKQLAPHEILGGLLFFASDPQRMTPRIREVRKPCLAYKVLAAGRLCANAKELDQAFAYAYANIKPIDGVITGMYPVFADEVAEDAGFARKHGTLRA